MIQLQPYLEGQIKEFFKMPQLLTSGIAADFIVALMDIFALEDEWNILTDANKKEEVRKALLHMESYGTVRASTTQVKERHFDDDINPPNLPKRVKIFYLKR